MVIIVNMTRKTPRAYIYRRSYPLPTIPENGWLQCCYMCNETLTGNTIIYKVEDELKMLLNKDIVFEVYLCNHCNYMCESDPGIKEHFNARVRAYIERTFIESTDQ